ncbi:ATP-grasp domain-containing protein [Bacillus sp. BGMRC 2118]|nr:ATP-grasp domain-containing protein [Bacillus sp. BGMRC 2118]
MQTIVFVGSNKSGTSRDALKLSEELGYFTVLLTDREKFLQQREEFYEVHQMIYVENLAEKETVMQEINKLQAQGKDIQGCMSLIDPFVHLAASITNELGLASLSTEALYLMEDKTRFREKMRDHPATPQFQVYRPDEKLTDWIEHNHFRLPMIIKSPVSNGSKDVFLIESKDKLKQGMRRLLTNFPDTPILIEEFINGPQYLVEVIVYNKEVNIVGIIQQEIEHLQRFIVTDYCFPALLSVEDYDSLKESVQSIVHSLGLQTGTCHLEIRLQDGEWKLIEINPRMSGGAMNRIIYEGVGIDLVKETLHLYLGKEPELQKQHQKFVYVKYLTVGTRGRLLKVTGKGRASKYEGVKDVYVKPRKGSILGPPSSMGDRYAYVLASAETPQKAKQIAMNAAKEIKFYLEPL